MAFLSSNRIYSGRVINLDLDEVELPNGARASLEMIRHSGAAAVVPFLDPPTAPDPRVVLIRQYRHAANTYLYEVPAGRLDGGESPERCARRELQEETGYAADQMVPLLTIYTTPGFTDEQIHLFWAQGLRAGSPAREPDELIEPAVLRWSALWRRLGRGEISDAKTLTAKLLCDAFLRRRPQ
ncbi:MAG: NUDIX hydrolase [Gemmatimonadales bacterium]|nr:MAG: NUDIX hydrolase [Gemmatimonadales bacterium]